MKINAPILTKHLISIMDIKRELFQYMLLSHALRMTSGRSKPFFWSCDCRYYGDPFVSSQEDGAPMTKVLSLRSFRYMKLSPFTTLLFRTGALPFCETGIRLYIIYHGPVKSTQEMDKRLRHTKSGIFISVLHRFSVYSPIIYYGLHPRVIYGY